jgi:ribulose-phosphate 3-epimerase
MKKLRNTINEKKLNIDIEIDGGINFDNSKKAKEFGANILVSGSTVFKEHGGDLKKNIHLLRFN